MTIEKGKEEKLQIIESETAERLALLDDRLEQSLIFEERYNKEVEAVTKDGEQRRQAVISQALKEQLTLVQEAKAAELAARAKTADSISRGDSTF